MEPTTISITEILLFILMVILTYIVIVLRCKAQEKDSHTETKLKDLYKCPVCESVYQDGGKYGDFHLFQANGSYGRNVDLESIINKKCNSCNKK